MTVLQMTLLDTCIYRQECPQYIGDLMDVADFQGDSVIEFVYCLAVI
jgi:hypothetical protein